MEPQRFLHIIRARWWVIALVAVLGAVAAASMARANNSAIGRVYEAEAGINLARLTDEREDLFEARLESVLGQAEVALQTQLAGDDSLSVYANPATGRILFSATAGDEIQAERLARDLRAAYLVAGPIVSDADQVAATLRDLRADIEELEAEIALLRSPVFVDPDVEALRLQLDAEIARLREYAASLKLQIKYPDLFPPVGIPTVDEAALEDPPLLAAFQLQRQLDDLELALIGLEAESAALGPPPDDTVSNDLEELVLQRQLTDLEERYVELSVQLVAVEAGDSAIDPFVPVIDRTPGPQPVLSAGLVGLLAGGLLAMVGLLVLDRTRRPLLVIEDVADYSPLGTVDRRRRGNAALPWYPQGSSTRRRQIQVVRGSLEQVIGDVPSTILVSGVSVGQLDTRELAADLAGAFAATGRRVLLIDASLEEGPYLPEYDQMGPSLVELLNEGIPGGSEDLTAAIKTTFVEREPVLPGLVSMAVGGHGRDPVDLFAGTRYRTFLDVALTEFDLVLVAAPEIDDPAANTFAQRSKFVVLVAGAWRTTEVDLERSLAVLGRSDESVYVAMLEGNSGSHLSRVPGRKVADTAARKAAKFGFSVVDLVSPRFPGPRILIYHQVGSNLGREMEVTTANFEKQIEWLQNRGEIVDLTSALSRRAEPDSDRLFVLTFDDGFEDVYENAFPLLRDREIPFVLYLTTLPIETGEPLNLHFPEAQPFIWDQINEMLESGLVTVGAHTHTHPDLRTLNSDDVWRELTISEDLIEQHTGIRPVDFTYPWGYWSPTAARLVEEHYETATVGAGGSIDESSSLHALHRVPVQRSDGFWLFKRRMIGGFRLEDRIRRWRRGYQGP